MSHARVREVLYDSETALRLVDQELDELYENPRAASPQDDETSLMAVLHQAHSEITTVLDTLRDSKHTLRDISVMELHNSHTKIQEVSSATEVAATDIMDGLDRAQGLIDKLESLDTGMSGEVPAIRTQLRDELFAMMGPLQFQDITTQQLTHVSSLITSVETRLLAIASMLDGARLDPSSSSFSASPHNHLTFAESASVYDAYNRQAAADALFWKKRS